MKYKFIGVAVALLLAGCQTPSQDTGSGDITLSREVEIRFQGYLANPDGEFFAVSTDGQHWGYSICSAGLYGCVEEGDTVALRVCHRNSKGVPCKIYAMGEDILWQGVEKSGRAPARVSTEIGSGPIELSPRIRRYFKKYLDLAYPEYFAVSPNGLFAGYSLCRTNPPCIDPGTRALAVSGCVRDSGGLECRIYAIKRKVVWKNASAAGRGAVSQPSSSRQSSHANPEPETSAAGWERRSIAIQWSGISELVAGEFLFRRNGQGGKIKLTLPKARGQCSGVYTMTKRRRGVWSIACSDGMTASGTLTAYGRGKGSSGEGQDDKGRSVRFTVGGS